MADEAPRGQLGTAARLALLAVFGEALFYGLYIAMARTLDDLEFERFAVAVATVTLVAAVTTLGLDKYAMRVLPAALERGDDAQARGYTRFAIRRIGIASALGGLGTALFYTLGSRRGEDGTPTAILVAAAMLPVVALTQYGVEALSARGAETRALVLYRVLIPGASIALVALAWVVGEPLDGARATALWGAAWALALVLMAWDASRHRMPTAAGRPFEEPAVWQREALPFLAYGLAITSIAQIGVIALDRLGLPADTVGAYAVAARTANLVVVLATATNRFYAPQASLLLERGDFAGIRRARNQRLAWLAPTLVIFLVLVFRFGDEMLAIFDADFDEEARVALRILSVSSAVSTLFALAPTYLKYVDQGRQVLVTAGLAALLQIGLLLVLAPRYGATGAAIAYAVAMIAMYGSFAVDATRHMARGEPASGDT